ncbi:protein kinase domain-containing protein [Dactylosporangium sp. CA-139066]|uniref:serine/threonine-protein kinase n=1 Tax=Dactylosporangium sp. CA-139066 TaxID=3239930 RepID=UPI003D907201
MDDEATGDGHRLIGGRYRLEDVLGVGGMSTVWRARDEVLGRPVAVKLLSGQYVTDAPARRRIREEARAAAALSHPNVAQVHDYGEAIEHGQPIPYVVMELVPGPTLQQRAARAPLPPAEVFRIGAEVAAGLAAAHADGLVHRDVKPANVILSPAGAKVVDFGIAAAAGPLASGEYGAQVFGTPVYLAPERVTGDTVNAASDVYSLGIVLYKLLAERLPWPVASATGILEAHLHKTPDPLPERPGVPRFVADLCRRCLDKDPAARPTAAEVAAVLAEATGPIAAAPGTGAAGSGGWLPVWFAVSAAAVVAAVVIAWQFAVAPEQQPAAERPARGDRPAASGVAAPRGSGAAPTPTPAGENGRPRAGTATDPAVPGSAGGTTGAPPATTSTTSAPPTTGAPSAPRTFETEGGTVRAECTAAGQAHLLEYTPARAFRAERPVPGPAASVSVDFRHGNRTLRVIVTCPAGTPSADVTETGE